MPTHHVDELRIALRRPDGGSLTDRPHQKTRDPQPQAEAKRCRQRAIEDGNRTGGAAEQDRLGQGAVYRHGKTQDWFVHQITTPPPKEKNDKK